MQQNVGSLVLHGTNTVICLAITCLSLEVKSKPSLGYPRKHTLWGRTPHLIWACTPTLEESGLASCRGPQLCPLPAAALGLRVQMTRHSNVDGSVRGALEVIRLQARLPLRGALGHSLPPNRGPWGVDMRVASSDSPHQHLGHPGPLEKAATSRPRPRMAWAVTYTIATCHHQAKPALAPSEGRPAQRAHAGRIFLYFLELENFFNSVSARITQMSENPPPTQPGDQPGPPRSSWLRQCVRGCQVASPKG